MTPATRTAVHTETIITTISIGMPRGMREGERHKSRGVAGRGACRACMCLELEPTRPVTISLLRKGTCPMVTAPARLQAAGTKAKMTHTFRSEGARTGPRDRGRTRRHGAVAGREATLRFGRRWPRCAPAPISRGGETQAHGPRMARLLAPLSAPAHGPPLRKAELRGAIIISFEINLAILEEP